MSDAIVMMTEFVEENVQQLKSLGGVFVECEQRVSGLIFRDLHMCGIGFEAYTGEELASPIARSGLPRRVGLPGMWIDRDDLPF